MTMTYGKLSKICGTISVLPVAYGFLILNEVTDFGWTVFFVFLGFAVLFDRLDKKDDEIEMLRSGKKPEPEPTRQSNDPRSFDSFYLSDKHGDFKRQVAGDLGKTDKEKKQ